MKTNPKVLYITDLDGTLLHHDERISAWSCDVLNRLIEKGLLFSYATARSIFSSSIVTEGLNLRLPVIVNNGSFIMESDSKKRILVNQFSCGETQDIYAVLCRHRIAPLVYAIIDGQEKFSYYEEAINPALAEFVAGRKHDGRDHPLKYFDRNRDKNATTAKDSGAIQNSINRQDAKSAQSIIDIQDTKSFQSVTGRQDKEFPSNCAYDTSVILQGDVFYFTCIGEETKLRAAYEELKTNYNCIFQFDIYSHEPWLEIMPHSASKSHAIQQLKELYKCDKVIVFGDAANDIPMFQIADESYAMENAIDALKEAATAVIDSNENDGVAKWLIANAK